MSNVAQATVWNRGVIIDAPIITRTGILAIGWLMADRSNLEDQLESTDKKLASANHEAGTCGTCLGGTNSRTVRGAQIRATASSSLSFRPAGIRKGRVDSQYSDRDLSISGSISRTCAR